MKERKVSDLPMFHCFHPTQLLLNWARLKGLSFQAQLATVSVSFLGLSLENLALDELARPSQGSPESPSEHQEPCRDLTGSAHSRDPFDKLPWSDGRPWQALKRIVPSMRVPLRHYG